jgi:CheY-like chemotaxis protein
MTETWQDFVAKSDGAKPRLLLVDDDSRVLASAKSRLERKGFEIVAILEGSEDLDNLSKLEGLIVGCAPRAVITDFDMSNFDGERLRAESKRLFPQLPVVLWCANEAAIQAAAKSGFNGAVNKVDDIDVMVKLLASEGINATPNKPPRS